ncbi:MAG: RNA 2'-phosphotransferase [Spirochaetota bacterium]|nr:RNA 2'-phosphotransferase [Spirochaetota bacterium]
MSKDIVKLSKFLSFILRHKPESIGITLDEEGWAKVDEIIEKSASSGQSLSRELIAHVVKTNNKKRFLLSEDQRRIRANQGHSIDVNLKLEAKIPPDTLYHGTAEKYLDSILNSGIEKRNKQHFHLSGDSASASSVDQRHGRAIVLEILSSEKVIDGYSFYLSENGVWLTDFVAVRFIKKPDL